MQRSGRFLYSLTLPWMSCDEYCSWVWDKNQEGVVSRSYLHNLLTIEVNSLSVGLFLAERSRTPMQKLCCCGYHRTQATKPSFDKKWWQTSEIRALEGFVYCFEWAFLMKSWDGSVNCGCIVCTSELNWSQPAAQVEDICTYPQKTL